MSFIDPKQFCLFARNQCANLSFFGFLTSRFFEIVNDVTPDGQFTFVAQVLVPILVQFLKAAKSYDALDVLYDREVAGFATRNVPPPQRDHFVAAFLYGVIVDLCHVTRLENHHDCNNAFSKKELRVSILAGRTGPKVFMQVASDGTAMYVNGEWYWEAENCLNNVNIDRHDDVENIKDIHRGVGILKMLHEFLHVLTPLFLDFDEYLKAKVLLQENVSKLQITPDTLGTREDSKYGIIGDMGYLLEEHLLGYNQRLFVVRSRTSVCDQFWKLKGVHTESILFDRVTRKITEFSTHAVGNESILLHNLVHKKGPFDFNADFKAIPLHSKKRSTSVVEETETITRSGRPSKKAKLATALTYTGSSSSESDVDESIVQSASAQEKEGVTNPNVKV